MSEDYAWSIVLALFLTVGDLVTAFFGFLGGVNMLNRHGAVGYIPLSFSVFLLYFSSGLWTRQHWKLYGRLAMYGVPFLLLLVAVVVLLVRAAAFGGPTDLVVVLVVGLVIIALSWLHLRLVLRTRQAEH